ncbi:SdhA, substrate of the Dot/Icm system [Legionella nautarum]|uniref:SdhA, substrate of the Dot/Icm system n=2 Tax=Legionella nautarum TaxID=45070 RepID=A0A0W0WLN2_9GAMM|nr:hypothetical protein [Legionella nautarum]KTD33155.1 SdhA, substrate of the Dot/Icm system [Legionella nautarum]
MSAFYSGHVASMLENVLKMLDAFKERQTSKFLLNIRQQILAKIQDSHSSLKLEPEIPALQSSSELQDSQPSLELETKIPTLQFSPELRPYFEKINRFGEPFTNFSTEPQEVIQIKEIINGIYHAEIAFRDLETVNLRNKLNWPQDLQQLWFHTVKHGYHASYLLTHLGIDLTNIFSAEITEGLHLLRIFNDFTDQYADDAAAFAAKLKEYPISFNGGLLSGITVDQMRAGSGKIDYHFLTQLSAALPGYIQQATNYIQQFSPQITSVKPGLDQDQVDKLHREGLKLLDSLSVLQNDNDLLLPAKVIYYVDILRRVIRLSKTTLEQAKNLDESSQEVIRNNLAELKYKWLIPLFNFVDRIEDDGLLAPGSLSNLVLGQLRAPYQTLISYTSSIVNFSVKGKELLAIEDEHFMELRLEPIRHKINQEKRWLIHLGQTEKACRRFFSLLKKNPDRDLSSLPESTRKLLLENYKFLHPFVNHFDKKLNNDIINALTKDSTWWSQVPFTQTKVKLSQILALKDSVETIIARDKSTQQFHIKLQEAQIESIYESAETHVFPYDGKTNHFVVDEAQVLVKSNVKKRLHFTENPPNRLVIHPEALTANQSFTLAEHYAERVEKLNRAEKAYKRFFETIRVQHPNRLKDLNEHIKKELLDLYCVFRPYLIDLIVAAPELPNYDQDIIDALQSPVPESLDDREFETVSPIHTAYFFQNNALRGGRTLQSWFTNTGSAWQNRAQMLQKLAQQKLAAETKESTLTPYENSAQERRDFLIKHRNYSQAVGEFKESLLKLTSLFNNTIQKELEPASYWSIPFVGDGAPFPELQNRNQLLAQGQQVIGIKRLINCLYHLEKICQQLEKLNDNNWEAIYVLHLVQANNHVGEILELSKSLYEDPLLRLLVADLVSKAKHISETLVSKTEPYRKDPTTVPIPENDTRLQYGSIWYSLNALMYAPTHIATLLNQGEVPSQEQERIAAHAKQVALNIESIIENSDSYFKLFLKTPMMYQLFKELKQKVKHFTTLSHDTVISHLEEINTGIFAQILLETDKWEDRVGLKPGQLSGPMKTILDEFYQGLVQPLGCASQKHIALITNSQPVTLRLDAVAARRVHAQKQKANYMADYLCLKKLVDCIKRYENFTSPGFGPPPSVNFIEFAKQDLLQAYEEALPLLQQQGTLFLSFAGEVKASPQIDELLTPKTPIELIPPSKEPDAKQKELTAEELKQNTEIHAKLKRLIDILGLPPKHVLKEMQEKLRSEFEAAIPILKQHKALLDTLSGEVKVSPQIDEILGPRVTELLLQDSTEIDLDSTEKDRVSAANKFMENTHILAQCQFVFEHYDRLVNSTKLEAKPTDQPRKVDIKTRCELVCSYYEGIVKTWELREKTAAEKEKYLTVLRDQQTLVTERATFNYINAVFKKQFDLALGRKTDLHLMQGEYNDKLKQHLLHWKPTILECAKNAPNIDELVQNIVQERVKNFDKEFYKKYAHLNEIMAELAEFESYLKQAEMDVKKQISRFETETTLQKKQLIITRLKNIATNPLKSTEARIKEMRTLVNSPLSYNGKSCTFREIMLEHSKHQVLTYEWLMQKVSSFLNLFNLLKPEYYVEYEKLNDAITTPPSPKSLNRYRIFTPTSRSYELPKPVVANSTSSENDSTPNPS